MSRDTRELCPELRHPQLHLRKLQTAIMAKTPACH